MKICRPIFHIFLGLLITACLGISPVEAKSVRIGIVSDGKPPRLPGLIKQVEDEIFNMTRGDHRVAFPRDKQLSGRYDLKTINQAIDRLLADPGVDIVLTLGEVGTHHVCRRNKLSKPVIAVQVIDAKIQNLPIKQGTSGVKNLNYINVFSDIDRAVQAFLEVTPFHRIAILMDGFVVESIPEIKILERRIANEFSLDVTLIKVDSQAGPALDQIPENTDAVYIPLLPRLSEGEFETLAQGLIERQLPSFSSRGRADVEKGILTSSLPEDRVQHLARSIAINVQEVLDGADAGDLNTAFSLGEKRSINMATARAIRVYPGWSILTEADLIHDEDQDLGPLLNIRRAVAEAQASNPDLMAANRIVQGGIQQVSQAKSALLPQVGIGTNARIIDDDRAAASLGALPEREWTGSIRASQLLYDDGAWANYQIEQQLQTSRVQDRNTVELEIIQAASSAYLNVLRAKSIERIQKENLKLTRKNLERARIRVSIGAAGPEEVYRWESQIADSRRQVLNAESNTLSAMSGLNQVLNRPLQDPFVMAEEEYLEPLSILPSRRMLTYMDNPQELNFLREFLVQEGMGSSPELMRLDALITAQERSIQLAKRDFWIPRVSLVGDVTESFSQGGEGTSSPPIGGSNLPSKDDTDWTAAISVTLPLFSGGGRSATLKRSREELSGLKNQYKSMANRIESQVLNSVYLVRASYPSIQLTLHAADAASMNLDLVTDSYVRGIKSIIDLIDAQNQALVADQEAANASYNFLIDLMTVQRSIGSFYLFDEDESRKAFIKRMEEFMAAKGVRAGP